jgi:hypothetical protein
VLADDHPVGDLQVGQPLGQQVQGVELASGGHRDRPRLGLHDHHAEVVGDDVVHLPGDPVAFRGHGAGRLRRPSSF